MWHNLQRRADMSWGNEITVWDDLPGRGGVHDPAPLSQDEIYILVPVIKTDDDPNFGYHDEYSPINYSWLPVPDTQQNRDLVNQTNKYHAICSRDAGARTKVAVNLANTYHAALDCFIYDQKLETERLALEKRRDAAVDRFLVYQYFYFGIVLAAVLYPLHNNHRPGPIGSVADRIFGGAKTKRQCRGFLGSVFLWILSASLWPLRMVWIFVWEVAAKVWTRRASSGLPSKQGPKLKRLLDATTLSGKRWAKLQARVAKAQARVVPAAQQGAAPGGQAAGQGQAAAFELTNMEPGRTGEERRPENPFEDPTERVLGE